MISHQNSCGILRILILTQPSSISSLKTKNKNSSPNSTRCLYPISSFVFFLFPLSRFSIIPLHFFSLLQRIQRQSNKQAGGQTDNGTENLRCLSICLISYLNECVSVWYSLLVVSPSSNLILQICFQRHYIYDYPDIFINL